MMQLGTRWRAGSEPPPVLPDVLRTTVNEVEQERDAAQHGWSWTLTWLEGRPMLELDDGTRVIVRDEPVVLSPDEDENDDEAW